MLKLSASLAQSVEQLTLNQWVVSSNLTGGTNSRWCNGSTTGSESVSRGSNPRWEANF